MKGHKVFVQRYNAQAVVDQHQIVIAAEVSTEPVDFSALQPLMNAARHELEQANISSRPRVAIADCGFWNEQQLDKLAADGIAVLVPPESGKRKGQRPGWSGGRYSWMRTLLTTDHGRELYRQRRQVIEPCVRSHQAQPQIHPASPTRPRRRAHRVAITDDDPQPDQALPPPNSHSRGLKRPLRTPGRADRAQNAPTSRARLIDHPNPETFARRPLAAGELSRSLPLRPAGDPKQQCAGARSGDARWLSLRGCSTDERSTEADDGDPYGATSGRMPMPYRRRARADLYELPRQRRAPSCSDDVFLSIGLTAWA